MKDVTKEQLEALEAMVDSASLYGVVIALATVAGDKAEHLRHAWQDGKSARVWDAAHSRLAALARNLDI